MFSKICELAADSKFIAVVKRFLYKNAKKEASEYDENMHQEYMSIFEEQIEVGLL